MSNFKRILALALTMLMVIGCFASVASVSAFNDLADCDYADAVNALSKLGIVEGYNDEEFKPNENVTRWQMALLVAKMLTGKVDDAYVNWYSTENFTPFVDVNQDQFYGSISYAQNLGIVVGTSATTFNPEGEITYQDALTMLVRVINMNNKDYDADAMNAGYPWTFINEAIKANLDKDFANKNYGDALTRAEVAQLLYNAMMYWDEDNESIAWSVFGYYDEEATIMVVAGADMKLPAAVATALDANIVYDSYNKIIDAKRGDYVAYVNLEKLWDNKTADYDAEIILASELGLEDNLQNAIGNVYNVKASTWELADHSAIKSFERYELISNKVTLDQTQFSLLKSDGAINGLKYDGTKYQLVDSFTFDYIDDDERNDTLSNELFLIDKKGANLRTQGRGADVETLELVDLEGDGLYDFGYYFDYYYGVYVGDNNFACQSETETVTGTFTDANGDAISLAAETPCFFVKDTIYGYTRIVPAVEEVVTGYVTGIDLGNNTITIDSIGEDGKGADVGTTYTYGMDSTAYAYADDFEADQVYGLNISTALLNTRVTLYAETVTGDGRVVLVKDATIVHDNHPAYYIVARDTHRTDANNNPIFALYDMSGELDYYTIEAYNGDWALKYEIGEIIYCIDEDDDGLLEVVEIERVEEENFNYADVDGWDVDAVHFSKRDRKNSFEMSKWHYIDMDTSDYEIQEGQADVNAIVVGGDAKGQLLYDFNNAVVMIYDDDNNTFIRYNGSDLGEGSKFYGDVTFFTQNNEGTNKNVVLAYVNFKYADVDVKPVVNYPTTATTIIYFKGWTDCVSYVNYDAIGGYNATDALSYSDMLENYAIYKNTKYTLVVRDCFDMVNGEKVSVTVENVEAGWMLEEGFYYVSDDGVVVKDKGEVVSARESVTVVENYGLSLDKYSFTVWGLMDGDETPSCTKRLGAKVIYAQGPGSYGTCTEWGGGLGQFDGWFVSGSSGWTAAFVSDDMYIGDNAVILNLCGFWWGW